MSPTRPLGLLPRTDSDCLRPELQTGCKGPGRSHRCQECMPSGDVLAFWGGGHAGLPGACWRMGLGGWPSREEMGARVGQRLASSCTAVLGVTLPDKPRGGKGCVCYAQGIYPPPANIKRCHFVEYIPLSTETQKTFK